MALAADQLRAQWEKEFSGSGATIRTLRESLVVADCLAQESQQAIVHLQDLLEPLAEPMHLWAAPLREFHSSLKLQYARDVRLRSFLLRQLHALQPAKKAEAAVKKEPVPVSPFSVEIGLKAGFFMQDVHVTVVDGKTISKFDVGRAHWLKERPDDICASWLRHYYFENAEIPAEYDFVLDHEGVRYPPAQSFFITYPADEFIRICQREEDTNSEHALDGKRSKYERREKAGVLERVDRDEFQSEETIDPA